MNRVLTFDSSDDSKAKFALLYQGFVFGGNRAENKSIDTVYAESKILDKIEKISSFVKPDDKQPTLNEGEQILVLTEKEHQMIQKYFESVAWLTSASQQVVKTLNWFKVAPASIDEAA